MIDRERQRQRQREKQAPCWEPDMGLDPRTPGSSLGPKADAQPLSHPDIPLGMTLKVKKRDPWVVQQFSACLWPRARSWRPRIESHVGLPGAWSLLLPLPVSLPLSLCVTIINKFKKKIKKKLKKIKKNKKSRGNKG